MPKGQSSFRQRPSVVLDAGYVPISPTIDENFHRERRQSIGIIVILIILFLLSFFNCCFLFWLIGQIDWSVISRHSKEISMNQSTFFDWIYSKRIQHSSPIDLLSDEQIDFYGHHNSILFDDHQIIFHTDNFHRNNSSSIDFSHLHRFVFDPSIPTRVHLAQISTMKIHHPQLYLHAHQSMKISRKTDQIQFYSQQLNFESNRHSSRSSLRFRSENDFHLKSDIFYLDLPQYPLHNRSISMGVSRLCLCDRNRLLFSIQADQACPFC